MSKALEERLYYLNRYYGRGGWHSAARMTDAGKKYQAMHERLLKNGFLEKDADYDLYRITSAGIAAIEGWEASRR